VRILRITLIAVVGLLAASCSKKSAADADQKPKNASETPRQNLAEGASESENESRKSPGEAEAAPDPEEIGEDCVAFLRATKAVPANRENTNCPQCPGNDASVEVLKFNDLKINRVTFSESTCEVDVSIDAQFNPSPGGNIVGGLIAWISPEQREQYSHGKAPTGRQVYKVKVIYRRAGGGWRAVEFDRADRD
jgi:hypothetical protein